MTRDKFTPAHPFGEQFAAAVDLLVKATDDRAKDREARAKGARAANKARAEWWGNEFLAEAHRRHPTLGAKLLVYRAHEVAAHRGIDRHRREEITESRARGFLARLKKNRV